MPNLVRTNAQELLNESRGIRPRGLWHYVSITLQGMDLLFRIKRDTLHRATSCGDNESHAPSEHTQLPAVFACCNNGN